LEKRLSKHEMTKCSKSWRGMAPLTPLWLRLCIQHKRLTSSRQHINIDELCSILVSIVGITARITIMSLENGRNQWQPHQIL